MAVYLSPVGNDQQLDSNGNPLVGGYWEVYAAGTTTPVTTYTSNTGLTAQPAQILLDASGRPTNPIWITGGIPVKFRLSSALAVVLLTIDNVSGINDPSGSAVTLSEWLASGFTPTYLSATSFSVAGDQTGSLQVGRRIRTTNTGGTVYSTITASVYGAVTTVTVVNDSGTLDSGLSVVAYGILATTNPSAPYYQAKAFCAWNGTTAGTYTPTLPSGNIASIQRVSAGTYSFVFSIAMPTADYVILASGNTAITMGIAQSIPNQQITAQSTTGFTLQYYGYAGSTNIPTAVDCQRGSLAVFR